MYPIEPKPQLKQIISLKDVQQIEEKHKQTVTGLYIKGMMADPYGHPVFASAENKVGSLVVFDAEEKQMLRKICPGYHSIDSCSFDSEFNFVMIVEKDTQRSIVKYNLKGDKVSESIMEDAAKLYAITVMSDGNIAVSVALDTHKQVVRIYEPHCQRVVRTIDADAEGKPYFLKPAYLTATGDRILVGDVGTKSIKCFAAEKPNEQLLWSYKMEMPRGMCIDGHGNICACDFRNNRITLLTPDGELIGHSFTGLSKPQYVSMHSNTLYVIDMGKSTNYRLTAYQLYKTARKHSRLQPEWQ